ncbi:MAG TPA: phosphotransferase [Woeseiaceae bacterium]|nr:phosphotransferase [Woeseiaceae bacterium]
MTHSENNPLAIIASELPQLTAETAVHLLREHYAIEVLTASPLVSERDQNFRLRTADGRRLVLKIANVAEEPVVTDFQIRALQHIERYQARHGTRCNAPRIVPTRDGRAQIEISANGQTHIARVVTFLAGVPHGDAQPSIAYCRNAGRYLAELDLALRDFDHPGANQNLLWDMKRAVDLRQLLPCISTPAVRERVSRCLDYFEGQVLPHFGSLRWQVIHNDLNPDNVLLAAEGSAEVVGIIDFGDMLTAPLAVDVAIAVSYLRVDGDDALAGILAFVSAYHRVSSLADREVDLLFDLIRARLAATISIRYWRISERSADDPYLQKILQENSAEGFLARLDELPREEVRRRLYEACEREAAGAPA